MGAIIYNTFVWVRMARIEVDIILEKKMGHFFFNFFLCPWQSQNKMTVVRYFDNSAAWYHSLAELEAILGRAEYLDINFANLWPKHSEISTRWNCNCK